MFIMAQKRSANDQHGAGRWRTVEDLQSHLDPIVAELGHMPSQPELRARKRFDLLHAIAHFGGQPAVAQALGYPYTGRKSWKHVEELRPQL